MHRTLLPALFLLCALPVLLFLALRVPTGEVPDEVAHIIRMESLRFGQVVGYRGERLDSLGRTVPDSGVTAHQSLLAAGFATVPGDPMDKKRMSRERIDALKAIGWGGPPGFVSVPNTAVYSPVLYAPGAVGMQVGKWLGFGPWQAILTARLFNAAAYAVAGCAALLLARRARGVIFAALSLPMALWMAASCNQDGLVIAMAALAAALLTRGTMAAWWAAAAAVAVVVMAKPVYLPIAGVVFVLLPRGGWRVPLRLAGAALAALPGLAWYAFAQSRAGVPFVAGAPYKAGPFWPGAPDQVFTVMDPALQLQVLLHRPSLLLTLPVETMWAEGGWYLWQMVGVLGLLGILLPLGLYAAWQWALVAAAVGDSVVARGRVVPGPGWRGLLAVLACVVACGFALFLGQYVSWSETGRALVGGVQGRYFIPLLPVLALALPALRVPGARVVGWAFRAPAVAAALAGLAMLPALVVGVYYLR